ncbi:MAG TPA: DUF3014 domain-containing protein [Myxococcales bacterium]|nr:DUF3014 domain-containing protein [Myxococcales bacterium]
MSPSPDSSGAPEEPWDPPRPRRGPGWTLPLLLLLAAGGWGAWWWLTHRGEPVAPAAVADAGEPDAGVVEPPLQESDPQVRNQLAGLSADPLWKSWLEQVDLVRRFAAAVQQVADGDSPRASVPFLAPSAAFAVREPKRGPVTIDPKSYARYDAVAKAFASLDAQKAAAAYRALQPLLDRAWRELGPPGTRFEGALARAVARLVEVPVPKGEVEVVSRGALWAFKDEALEQRSAAEKHLLRMGPENMQRVQVKLRELQGTLGLPEKP